MAAPAKRPRAVGPEGPTTSSKPAARLELGCLHCIACVSREDYGARIAPPFIALPALRTLLRHSRARAAWAVPFCALTRFAPNARLLRAAVCILAEVLKAKEAQQRSAYAHMAGPSLEAELAKILR